MIYRSEVNARLVSWRLASLSACVLSGASLLWAGFRFVSPTLGVAGLVMIVVSIVAGWLALFVRYEITRFELIVRRGPLRLRIPLECISGVQPSRKSITAPPWRPVKLCIAYRKGGREKLAHLSPEDRRGFLSELALSAPWLEVMGERLVRTPQVRQAL